MIKKFTKEQFLILFKKLLPETYWAKMEGKSGWEIFEAIGKVGERVSEAVWKAWQDFILVFSKSGSYATGQVIFTLFNRNHRGVRIIKGTEVGTEDGVLFETLDSIEWEEGKIGNKIVNIQSKNKTYQANVKAGKIKKIWKMKGEMKPIKSDEWTNKWDWQNMITINNLKATKGGRPAILEELAQNKGLEKSLNETDKIFKYRYRDLPDTVSPQAIEKLIKKFLLKYTKKSFYIYEHQGDEIELYGDVGFLDRGNPFQGIYNDLLFSAEDCRGWFTVRLPLWEAQGYTSLYLDKDFGDKDFADVNEIETINILSTLWQQINKIKAGGVGFWLSIDRTIETGRVEWLGRTRE